MCVRYPRCPLSLPSLIGELENKEIAIGAKQLATFVFFLKSSSDEKSKLT